MVVDEGSVAELAVFIVSPALDSGGSCAPAGVTKPDREFVIPPNIIAGAAIVDWRWLGLSNALALHADGRPRTRWCRVTTHPFMGRSNAATTLRVANRSGARRSIRARGRDIVVDAFAVSATRILGAKVVIVAVSGAADTAPGLAGSDGATILTGNAIWGRREATPVR